MAHINGDFGLVASFDGAANLMESLQILAIDAFGKFEVLRVVECFNAFTKDTARLFAECDEEV